MRRFFTARERTSSEVIIAYLSGAVIVSHGFWWFLAFFITATVIDITIWLHFTARKRS